MSFTKATRFKVTSLIAAFVFALQLLGQSAVFAADGTVPTGNSLTKLPYYVTDAVMDPEKPVIYMTSKGTKTVYAFNYTTGQTSTVQVDLPPESIDIGRGANDSNVVYVSLLKGSHDSMWMEKDQQGAVAVIDKNTFTLKDKFDVNIDPFDIVAGTDGYIYIPSGSGQWTEIQSYDPATKRMVQAASIRQQSYAKLAPLGNKIYTIDTDVSPRDFNAFNILNGQFTDPLYPGGYDSPYHGDYPLSTYFDIDPTGSYLFNGSGNIFMTSADQGRDMVYAGKLDAGFSGITFDNDLARVYTLAMDRKAVNIYANGGNDNFTYSRGIQLAGNGRFIFKQDGKLIVLDNPALPSRTYQTGLEVFDAATGGIILVPGTSSEPTPVPVPVPNPVPSPSIGKYIVQPGDTLSKIAQKYSTTVNNLVNLNNLANQDVLWVGQELKVPVSSEPAAPGVYTVQAGDTLSKIALKFGVTVNSIVDANKLANPNVLYVGQKLTIPAAGGQPAPGYSIYTVQAGDTLWNIAKRNNTSIEALVQANKLNINTPLAIGQKLMIPVTTSTPPASPATYTVQSGDSLWKISQKFNTTVVNLAQLNNISPDAPIHVGQVLKVHA